MTDQHLRRITRPDSAVHDCCGCSCPRCENGHNSGPFMMHTPECVFRFFKEQTGTDQPTGVFDE